MEAKFSIDVIDASYVNVVFVFWNMAWGLWRNEANENEKNWWYEGEKDKG